MPRHPLLHRHRSATRLARYFAVRRRLSDRIYATTPVRFLRRLNLMAELDEPVTWPPVDGGFVLLDARAADVQLELQQDVDWALPRAERQDLLPSLEVATDQAQPDADRGYRPPPQQSNGQTQGPIVRGMSVPARAAASTVRPGAAQDARRDSPVHIPPRRNERQPSGASFPLPLATGAGIQATHVSEDTPVPVSPLTPGIRNELVGSPEPPGTVAPCPLSHVGDTLESSEPGERETPVTPVVAAMSSSVGERQMPVDDVVGGVLIDPASDVIDRKKEGTAPPPEIHPSGIALQPAGDRETADPEVEHVSGEDDVNGRRIGADARVPAIAARDVPPAAPVDIPVLNRSSAVSATAPRPDATDDEGRSEKPASLSRRAAKRATIEELRLPGPAEKAPGPRFQQEPTPEPRAQQPDRVPPSVSPRVPGSDQRPERPRVPPIAARRAQSDRGPQPSSPEAAASAPAPGSDSNLIGDYTPKEWHARLVAVARAEAEARGERAHSVRSSVPDLRSSTTRPAPRIEHPRSSGSPHWKPAQPDERLRLSEGARRFLKPLVGLDPADVPIFQGERSSAVTGAFAADAVTVAGAIALGPGYDGERPRGLALLAHELTHVARQRQPRFVPPVALGPTHHHPTPAFEPAEESLATRVEARVETLASVAHDVNRGGISPDAAPSTAASPSTGESQPALKRGGSEWGGLPAPWEPLPEWLVPAASEPSPTGGRPPTAATRSSPPMAFAAPPMPSAMATDSPTGTVHLAETGRVVSEGAPATPAGPSDADGSRSPAPDIDALARQVFAALKRRLEAEIRRQQV